MNGTGNSPKTSSIGAVIYPGRARCPRARGRVTRSSQSLPPGRSYNLQVKGTASERRIVHVSFLVLFAGLLLAAGCDAPAESEPPAPIPEPSVGSFSMSLT